MPTFLLNIGSMTTARAVQALSQIVALPFFARVLSIEDFALLALAMTVVNFTNVVSDAGLGRSLIRQTEFDRREWSSVFWMLAALGVALALATVAAAYGMAAVMAMPALAGVMSALCVVPLLQALSSAPSAALERENRFGVIAVIQIVAALLALLLAVGLAAAGAGVWALVAQQIALPGVLFVAVAAVSPFRPGRTFDFSLVRPHLRFGKDTLLVSLLYTAQRQIPVMAIGRALGPVPLGLYAMNERLMRLPRFGIAGPFGRVAYVRMVRAKDDPVELGRLYVASIRLLALAIVPGMAMLAASGEAVFALLFSEKWRALGLIFALLAPAVAIETATSGIGGLFNATGRTELRVRMALERAVLFLAVFAAAVPFGLEAVVAAKSLVSVLYLRRLWGWGERCATIPVGEAFRALTLPLLGTAPFALGLVLATRSFGLSDLDQLVLAIVGTAVATGVTALIGRHALVDDLRWMARKTALATPIATQQPQ